MIFTVFAAAVIGRISLTAARARFSALSVA